MSKKVFLSFLGTNNYVHCNYLSPGIGVVHNIKYVQEATIVNHCSDFDEYLIFVTEDAKQRNWNDNGFLDRNGTRIVNEGLDSRLRKLNLDNKVSSIDINEGYTNEGVWDIFQKVYDSIEFGSTIVFDITHAFRFLPMLGMVLINYLKTIKSVEISGIYYGAFEALGSFSDVKDMSIEERNVEILDLTSFSLLQDWTNAANVFLKYGGVSELKLLCEKGTKDRLIKTSGKDQAAQDVKRFGKSLEEFSQSIYFIRGKKIIDGKISYTLNRLINDIQDSAIPALNPILERIKNEFQLYQLDSINNSFEAVKWCVKNDLIQQGFTLLQEGLITYLASELKEDFNIEATRNAISSSFTIYNKNIPEYEWKGDAAEKSCLVKNAIENPLFIKLAGFYISISELRNDLNHAGMRDNPVEPSKLSAILAKYLFEVETIIKNNNAPKPL